MFQNLIPKWSNVFWNMTGVASIDTYYNKWHVIISILLAISCVFNIYITPKTICELEGSCDNSLSTQIKGLFMRTVAFSCLTSKIMAIQKGKTNLVLYQKNIEKFHTMSPMTHSEIRVLRNVSFLLIISCLLLTLPANYISIWDISFKSGLSVLGIVFKYIQNFSVYCVETHFMVLCFILYQKFVDINRDLMAIKIDTIIRNKYPFITTRTQKNNQKNNSNCDYNKDVLHFLAAGHPMIDFVEQLKLKHKLVREATKNLNDLFGIHLGLSICSLCLFIMFDLYYFFIAIMSQSNYKSIIYGWILQYTVRFGSITILAHLTSKEVRTTIRTTIYRYLNLLLL